VLAAVVDEGGYAQAAAALHRSQPAVSYAVARLQEALGVELLAIEGRKAVLTAVGDTLLKRARSVLMDVEALERLAKNLKQGWEAELRLVVDFAFPRQRLLAILGELKELCPQTQIQLTGAVLSGSEDAIVDGSADVVLTTRVPPGFLGDWLMDVPFTAVAQRNHPLFALGRPLTTEDLAKHTQAVVRDTGRNPRDEGWLGSPLRWTVPAMDSALAVVRAGFAYAWLPEHVIAGADEESALQPLPLAAGGTRKVPIYVVLVRPQTAGPAARAALELFQRRATPEAETPLPSVRNDLY